MKKTLTRILTGVAIVGFSSVALADQPTAKHKLTVEELERIIETTPLETKSAPQFYPMYFVRCVDDGKSYQYRTCQQVDAREVDRNSTKHYFASCSSDPELNRQLALIHLDEPLIADMYRRVPINCEELK